jgi:hypothetical protein
LDMSSWTSLKTRDMGCEFTHIEGMWRIKDHNHITPHHITSHHIICHPIPKDQISTHFVIQEPLPAKCSDSGVFAMSISRDLIIFSSSDRHVRWKFRWKFRWIFQQALSLFASWFLRRYSLEIDLSTNRCSQIWSIRSQMKFTTCTHNYWLILSVDRFISRLDVNLHCSEHNVQCVFTVFTVFTILQFDAMNFSG